MSRSLKTPLNEEEHHGMPACISVPGGTLLCALTSTVEITDIPTRSRLSIFSFGSMTIFTGTRCTILVKFPVALSGLYRGEGHISRGRETIDMTAKLYAGVCIDSNEHGLIQTHLSNLALLKVC